MVLLGTDSENGLIVSVATTAAHGHDLTPPADLLHRKETLVFAFAGCQATNNRPDLKARDIGCRVGMGPAQRRA